MSTFRVCALVLSASASACTGTVNSGEEEGEASKLPGPVATDPGDDPGCDPVQEIFARSGCLTCHDSSPGVEGGNLDLESDGLAQRLLGVPTANPSCSGVQLVNAVEPANSMLLGVLGLGDVGEEGCEVSAMPLGVASFPALDMRSEDKACVQTWVNQVVAGSTGPDPEVAPFDPAPALAGLSKTKYLLSGEGITDDDIKATVTADGELDREALRTLVDGWVWESPGVLTEMFERKLRRFIEVTLQQRPTQFTGKARYTTQVHVTEGFSYQGVDADALFETIPQVWVRTALDIIVDGRDFREIATTRRWSMTTATLMALLVGDRSRAERAPAFPTQAEVDQGLATEVDSQRRQWRLTPYLWFEPSDYTDWRPVNILEASEEQPPDFVYEYVPELVEQLRAIGPEGSIRVRTPRVGFFTSHEFIDNWRFNDDNQWRLTLMQTLIAALDLQFNPADLTHQPSLIGLDLDDPEFGNETSPCYGCHRLMDPMRLVFTNGFNGTGRRRDPDAEKFKPSFAIAGHVVDIESFDDFGQAIASHPRFATAWVQKLCMWANGDRCDDDDPEVLRIARLFAEGYSDGTEDDFVFSILLREMFSSPLITATELTRSHETREYRISGAPGEHACDALDARLDRLVEVRCERDGLFCDDLQGKKDEVRGCSGRVNQQQAAESLGTITYTRGSQDLSVPNTVDMSRYRSAELVCDGVGFRYAGRNGNLLNIVDGEPPIDEVVEFVMGLPPSHPRHQPAVEALRRFYDIQTARPACSGDQDPTDANAGVVDAGSLVCGYAKADFDALRSVVALACSSPELFGIGF